MKKSIRTIMFDVFGTVVDWRMSIANEVRQIPELSFVNGEEFADRWRAKYQPAMERVRSGGRTWVKLDDLHFENLNELLDDLGVESLSDEIKFHLNHAWHRLEPWPDSVEGLTRLKKRYTITTLSNGNVSLLLNMAKRAGLPWDMILGAEIAKHYKPQPESYLNSADLIDVDPAECMLTAAHNSDLIAAAACGFRTAFVARPTEYGPAQTEDLEPSAQFDFVAKDFVDLAAQLGC